MRNRFLVLFSLIALLFSTAPIHADESDCMEAYSMDNEKYLDDKAQLEGKNMNYVTEASKVGAVVCFILPLALKAPMAIAPCEALPATAYGIIWQRKRELPGLVSKYAESRDVFLAYANLQKGNTEDFKDTYAKFNLTSVAAQNAFNERFMEAMDTGKFCKNGKKMNIKEAISLVGGQGAEYTN